MIRIAALRGGPRKGEEAAMKPKKRNAPRGPGKASRKSREGGKTMKKTIEPEVKILGDRGVLTVPIEIRRRLKLVRGSLLYMSLDETNAIVVRPVDPRKYKALLKEAAGDAD